MDVYYRRSGGSNRDKVNRTADRLEGSVAGDLAEDRRECAVL